MYYIQCAVTKPSANLCINWSIALNLSSPLTDLLLGFFLYSLDLITQQSSPKNTAKSES